MQSEKHPGQKRKVKLLPEGERSVKKWDADEEQEISNLSFEQFVESLGLDHHPRPEKTHSRKG